MKKNPSGWSAVLILAAAAFMLSGSEEDPLEETKEIWTWRKPAVYPQPIPGELDIETLSRMLDSGNLQWYMPRPEDDQWDAIAAMKIHAPLKLVWDVVTDYERYSEEYMPDVLLESKTLSRDGNTVENWHRAVNTVLRFEYKYEIYDIIRENPPYHIHSETIDGGLKHRQIDWYMVPADHDQTTLIFIRHYPHIKSLGVSIRLVLAVIPTIEWPVSAQAANYILRGFRLRAENLAGYDRARVPPPLDYDSLDIETLRILDQYACGLIHETPEGRSLGGTNYTFINAPHQVVWDVITDFEHFEEFKDCTCIMEKREGNRVWVRETLSKVSILIFTFGGFEMHSVYTLDPPYHLGYKTIDGLYEGSGSDYHIVPVDEGRKTLLFNSIGMNYERDQSLTMRMVKSGAFPFRTMLDVTLCRTNLSSIKKESERRAGTQNK
jgi:hypothetical protein